MIAVAVVVTVFVVMIVAVSRCDSLAGTGEESGFTVRAAHGPTRVIDNVPAGYTRDAEGAATAAVNAVQALAEAGQGRIDMANVVRVVVAAEPGPQLRESIEISRDRGNDGDVLTVLPAAVSVLSLTDTAAEVSVWTMGVSRASIAPGDPVSVTTLWTSNTVSLVWEGEDWKVKEKTGQVGPTPDEVIAPDAPSPLTRPLVGGYYSFYVN
ncbi:hypothetical protein ACFWPH_28165 [Nocardia sp. NPDC058499]|uniref:hypothetical protein n=1 Tax=Nocardia sp. NPDC058499 TaxID=3346530 RepID=UPI00365FB9CD